MSDIYEQIREAGTQRETKADIIDYYQQAYTGYGQHGWKQNLIHDLLRSKDITPNTVGEKEYARLTKNTAKRFDTQRRDNPEPRNAAEYEALGEGLPPMPPENGYHIFGIIYVAFSDGECEEREIDEYITGKAAEKLANSAEEDIAQRITNHYMEEDDTDEPTASIGNCDPPQLNVEAIE